VSALGEGDHGLATRQHPATPRADAGKPALPSLEGVAVLVVDDDGDARELMRRILTTRGAEVTTVDSAAAALAAIRQRVPAVLVSDIGMPDHDGYELIRSVRALPAAAGGRIPAIALTAFARSEDRQRTLLAGYQMHVAKPVEPAELIAVCASLAGCI
jgi:CheY-like chemotaxis protein